MKGEDRKTTNTTTKCFISNFFFRLFIANTPYIISCLYRMSSTVIVCWGGEKFSLPLIYDQSEGHSAVVDLKTLREYMDFDGKT